MSEQFAENHISSRPLRRGSPTQTIIVYSLLGLVLLVGAYFRFTGQNWDDYTHLHPDERFLTGVAQTVGGPLDPSGSAQRTADTRKICSERYPDSKLNGGADNLWSQFFDTRCSTLYPKNASSGTGLYVYGELPLFTMKFFSELTRNIHSTLAAATPDAEDDLAAASWTNYAAIQLVGRSVSAGAELLSLVFIFLIGRRLYNPWIGLIAAALAAAAVFPIQLSHYWTTDAFTNLPVTIAFWFAVRAMDHGKWGDFVGFGLATGAAMASRINTLPIFGVIVLAAMLHALPALDLSLVSSERGRLFRKAALGVMLAVLFTVLGFRLTMPHAFEGGGGILGFFNLTPYGPWLDDLAQASNLSSGKVDFPPDFQWANRTAYLYPWRNMVLWGMGLPLGLTAWLAWLVAAIQCVRGKPLWTRHILLVVWILVYFGYMGRQWVTTMRYFMPIYPFLIILAAWALYELFVHSVRVLRAKPAIWRQALAVAGTVPLILVLVATFAYAAGFVRIFQRQLTRVEASRYTFMNFPSAVSTTLALPDGRQRLVNFQMQGNVSINVSRYDSTEPKITPFVTNSRQPIDRILITRLIDPDKSEKTKRLNAAITENGDTGQILANGVLEAVIGADSTQTYTMMLNQPITLDPTHSYILMTWTDDTLAFVHRDLDNAADFTLSNANSDKLAQVQVQDLTNSASTPEPAKATFSTQPATGRFRVPADGIIDRFNLAHVLGMTVANGPVEVRVVLKSADGRETLAQGKASIDVNSTKTSPLGDPASIPLDRPVPLKTGIQYNVEVNTTTDTPLQIVGTVIANEGPWDDPIPWKVCPLPVSVDLTHDTPSGLNPVTCDGVDGFGWYKQPEMFMAAEDDVKKRSDMQMALNQADYMIISSNRFYDSQARLPMRFPMSNAYYKALFAGQLGYDLHKTIASFAQIGPFEIADQNLPIYNTPAWVKEWQSEEAFSVYDHPTVFIFKRSADYSPRKLADFLNGIPISSASDINVGRAEDPTLINRVIWNASDHSRAPTGFKLTDEQEAIQSRGGTWSDLFNRESIINQNAVVSVIVWWLMIMVFGFAAWPLLYLILPGLADRGYPIAKIAGVLIVSWIVWAGGTLRLLMWSQAGIGLTLLVMALLSAWVVWRRREEITTWVRTNWRYMVIVELITLILYMAFVFIRLGNPDLWAQSLGGEKPMDFAYFNAVLRSTIFPPYDPWYAGGYLNYYYYGYVFVGAPVKLLGMVPSIAYNLIVPTLFAMTGIAAFSVAFNLAASRWFFPRDEGKADGETLAERRRFALRTPQSSPYLAGAMALILCVVVGNLDTPRTFLAGIAKAGGYTVEAASIYTWKLSKFQEENNRAPDADEREKLLREAQSPSLGDQVGFFFYDSDRALRSFGSSISNIIGRGVLTISPDRWFWGPRSIVGELPNNSNEINEMPFFTFVFGDLHAHMIAFPMTLLVIAWVISEVLAAGYVRRPTWLAAISTIYGGLTVGTLQPTNTWDWFTYLVLALAGLIFAIYLRRRPTVNLDPERFGRRTVIAWVGYLGGFFAVQWLVALPFTAFWNTSYVQGSFINAFTGNKTPLWAYFTIHGVFLFIIMTALLWQTVGLLRRVYVRDLVGQAGKVGLVAGVIGVTMLVSLTMTVLPLKISLIDMPIPLAILCIPLLVWCAILFLMPGQSRENQIVLALIGLAVGVSFGVEIVVLAADIGRQNTFFKFYLQAWILFSLAAGVMVAWLFHESERWQSYLRTAWLTGLALLLTVAGLYPIMATQGKIALRMAVNAPRTLDGDAYMDYATYYEGSAPIPLTDDLAIIKWLQDNVQGSPVILEGVMTEYKLGSRISISTGLPTVVGWNFHQRQQRTLNPLPNLIFQRHSNVAALYNTLDVSTAWRMLKFYEIEYIVVGKLEQTIYLPEGLQKFELMVEKGLLQTAYNQRGDKIYKVNLSAAPPELPFVGGR